MGVSKTATKDDIDELDRSRVQMLATTKTYNYWSDDRFKDIRMLFLFIINLNKGNINCIRKADLMMVMEIFGMLMILLLYHKNLMMMLIEE